MQTTLKDQSFSFTIPADAFVLSTRDRHSVFQQRAISRLLQITFWLMKPTLAHQIKYRRTTPIFYMAAARKHLYLSGWL